MSPQQIAGLVAAAMLAAYAAYIAVASRRRAAAAAPGADLDACAAAALALAARLRVAGCPEGVVACQALLNVILEHPGHRHPEVTT
jgi:hypothetical protein